MKTLETVVADEIRRMYFNKYLERVEYELKDTLLGAIQEWLIYKPAQAEIYAALKGVDIVEQHFRLDNHDLLLSSINEGLGEWEDVYLALRDEGGEDVENLHFNFMEYFDDPDPHIIPDLENTTYTAFHENIGDLAPADVVDDIAESLVSNNPPSLDDFSAGVAIQLSSSSPAIADFLADTQVLPQGLFTDISSLDDDEVNGLIAKMIALDPDNFVLNAESVMYSDMAVEAYYRDLFPEGNVPPHLVPLCYIHQKTLGSGYKTIPNCRIMMDYETYQYLRAEGFDSTVDYVIPSNTSELVYNLENVDTLLFVSPSVQDLMREVDTVVYTLPDYMGAQHSTSISDGVYRINAPDTTVMYMVIAEDIQFTASESSQFKAFTLNDTLDTAAPTKSYGLYPYLNLWRSDYRVSRTSPMEYTTDACAEIDLPSGVDFDITSKSSYAGGIRVILTTYIDEYLSESNNFIIDEEFLSAIGLGSLLSKPYMRALDIRDRTSHAVLGLPVLNAATRVKYLRASDSKYVNSPQYKVCTKLGSRVSIILYPGFKVLIDKDVRCVDAISQFKRWDMINFSACTSVMKDVQGLDLDVLKYIGFKKGKSFFKDSNFIAYAYIYMFLPQIIGRFGEHSQDDTSSQTLPLGTMLNIYFRGDGMDPPENPRQFLETARYFTLNSYHPLMPPGTASSHGLPSAALPAHEFKHLSQQGALGTYNSALRFLYSFTDTYTRPLAILYNAHQFAGARPNPELRPSKPNITSNYPLNYSDGSWVAAYMEALKESQGDRFAQSSHLNSDVSSSAIEREISRFTSKAQVKEFFEIEILRDVLYHTTIGEMRDLFKLPDVNTMSQDIKSTLEVTGISADPATFLKSRYSSRRGFEERFVYDFDGEFEMGAFSQQLTASITFLARFASFVIGTFITDNFENSDYFKLFLTGNSSPDAPVKHTIDFRELLQFPIVTRKLAKIVKNPEVKSTTGDRVRFTVSNLRKNLVPLDLIRYALTHHFSNIYTYRPMGIDKSEKIPKGQRMSLGAYCTIFTCLAASKKAYIGLQNTNLFGPVQSVFEGEDVRFEAFKDEKGAVDFSEFGLTVRQATASLNPYSETSDLVAAADESISSRLSALTSAYQICIGQAGMGYIKKAQEGELEVFTFFAEDTNVSTLGLELLPMESDGVVRYTIADSNGANNTPCYTHSVESSQYIINWLADLFLEHTMPEEGIRAILEGRRYTYSPQIEFDLNTRKIRTLFERFHKFGENFDADSGLRIGGVSACHKLRCIFEDYTCEQIKNAIPKLTSIHANSIFDLLLLLSDDSKHVSSYPFSERLLDNRVSPYRKPLFRSV